MTFLLTKNTTNALKCIAAIMVMLHHYSQRVCAIGDSDLLVYKLLSNYAGYIGVALFFFLSGYGLMESEQNSHLNLYSFFKRRFLKVYLPVLLVTTLWMLASQFLGDTSQFYSTGSPNMWGRVLYACNLFVGFGDPVLWFIEVLIVLYISFYIFSCIYLRDKRLGLSFLALSTVFNTLLTAVLCGNVAAISVPLFSLGVMMSLIKNKKHAMSIIVILIGLLAIAYSFCKGLAIPAEINLLVIGTLILVLSIKQIDFQFPAILGVISFDLYLIHNKVLMALKDSDVFPTIWMYVLITFILTEIFYLFRTKILKI